MTLIQRLRDWWNQPTWAEKYLEDKFIVDAQRWDGYPSTPDECRRSYVLPSPTTMSNVNCSACGGPIHAHDVEVRD